MFRFLSEDWSPWIALLRMRERWPELRFEMKAGIWNSRRPEPVAKAVFTVGLGRSVRRARSARAVWTPVPVVERSS
jgi:hypothetical protein